jgi:hypothetical protein
MQKLEYQNFDEFCHFTGLCVNYIIHTNSDMYPYKFRYVSVPGCSLLFQRKADVHLDVIDFCISLSFYRLPEDHDFPAIHAGVPSLLLGLGGKERNMTIGY